MKKANQEKSISPDNKLFICMDNKKKKLTTFKKNKPHTRKVADELFKTHERNEKLREKKIDTSFLDLF